MDSGKENLHLLNYIDEVLGHCEVRRALDKVPHVPIVGALAVSTFNGNLQVNPSFMYDIFALHATDEYSK